MSEETIAELEFTLSYFSEVTVNIRVRKYVDTDEGMEFVQVVARHPYDWPNSQYYDEDDHMGLGGSWYHFSGRGPDRINITSPITEEQTERRAVLTILEEVERKLAPGALNLIEDHNSDDVDQRMQFKNDFWFAFLGNSWAGMRSNFHKDTWIN